MAALCKVGGEDPPRPVPLSAAAAPEASSLDEIKYLYRSQYAPGLDQFLECNWFGQHSLPYLLDNTHTLVLFANLLQLFQDTTPEQYDNMRKLPSAESELVWELMKLARCVPADLADQSPELQVVLNRLLVVEHLTTGQVMPEGPVAPEVIANTSHVKHPARVAFWKHLSSFVSHRKPVSTSSNTSSSRATPATANSSSDSAVVDPAISTDPSSESWTPADARAALTKMRSVLGEQENRDVLYSMAVVRHLGPRFPGEVGPGLSAGADNGDGSGSGNGNGNAATDKQELDRLRVAKRFLEDEASGNGLTQVVQRLCGMAVRSWSAAR